MMTLHRDRAPATAVILRDGSTLRLRRPAQADRAALLAFLAALSPESLSARYHAAVRPRADLVAGYLDPDSVDRGALIGTLGDGDDERIVGLGTYDRLRDVSSAEVAFAVADELQGIGVGTRLLEQLAPAQLRAASSASCSRSFKTTTACCKWWPTPDSPSSAARATA